MICSVNCLKILLIGVSSAFICFAAAGVGALPEVRLPGNVASGQQSQAAYEAFAVPNALTFENQARTASHYTLVAIKIPGATYVEPFEINNRRVVSGVYGDATSEYHSFIWIRGKITTIDKPGEPLTAVGAITDTDRLFGNWGTAVEQHAGYYDLHSLEWVQLPDLPGYPLNIGSRMNNSGFAVGYACRTGTLDTPENCDAWSWNGSAYSVYAFPGATSTFANGVNDETKQVGLFSTAPFTYLGYSRYHDALQDLQVNAGGQFVTATAYDINDDGAILAAAPLNSTGYWPSFILRGPDSYELLPDYPGVLRTFYLGMNENEDLAGIWFNDPSGFPYFGFAAFRDH